MNTNTITITNSAIVRRVLPIVWLAFACLLFVGCDDPEPPDPAAQIPDWRTYYNRDVGVEFKYPYTLKLEIDTTDDEQLVARLLWVGAETPVFKLETESAVSADQLEVASRGDVIIDGVRAMQSTIEIAGEKVKETKVANDGRIFIFTGSGATYDKVLESVKFLDDAPTLLEPE
jgi:hypothetical protein